MWNKRFMGIKWTKEKSDLSSISGLHLWLFNFMEQCTLSIDWLTAVKSHIFAMERSNMRMKMDLNWHENWKIGIEIHIYYSICLRIFAFVAIYSSGQFYFVESCIPFISNFSALSNFIVEIAVLCSLKVSIFVHLICRKYISSRKTILNPNSSGNFLYIVHVKNAFRISDLKCFISNDFK